MRTKKEVIIKIREAYKEKEQLEDLIEDLYEELDSLPSSDDSTIITRHDWYVADKNDTKHIKKTFN